MVWRRACHFRAHLQINDQWVLFGFISLHLTTPCFIGSLVLALSPSHLITFGLIRCSDSYETWKKGASKSGHYMSRAKLRAISKSWTPTLCSWRHQLHRVRRRCPHLPEGEPEGGPACPWHRNYPCITPASAGWLGRNAFGLIWFDLPSEVGHFSLLNMKVPLSEIDFIGWPLNHTPSSESAVTSSDRFHWMALEPYSIK